MGWTFMQPSALLAVRPLLADVEVAEMQPPVQSRELFLIRREAEFNRETQLLFELCRRILESRLVPEMLAIAPWLGDGLRLPEAASAQ